MAGIVALAVVGWMFSDDLLRKYGGDTAKEIATADTIWIGKREGHETGDRGEVTKRNCTRHESK